MRPRLFTFDIFGTVIDWRRGLRDAVRDTGVPLDDATFDRVIDAQADDESGAYRPYSEIVSASLTRVLRLPEQDARRIGLEAGSWPFYDDSHNALERLMSFAPCAATTNSDRVHGTQVQARLGLEWSAWICAEDVRVYKPDPRLWREVSARVGVDPGRWWWHVSAYGDYDLATARDLGLTCVYVTRPHARPGPSDVTVPDLAALADRVEREFGALSAPS